MMYEWFTPPSVRVNVQGCVMTKIEDPTYRRLAVSVFDDNVFLSGDWPTGTNKVKMAHDIVAAIKANLPDEGEK